jgi:hypothetical protein
LFFFDFVAFDAPGVASVEVWSELDEVADSAAGVAGDAGSAGVAAVPSAGTAGVADVAGVAGVESGGAAIAIAEPVANANAALVSAKVLIALSSFRSRENEGALQSVTGSSIVGELWLWWDLLCGSLSREG